MGIQVLPLRAGLETGLGPDINSFTRRRSRTEGLGIYHMVPTGQLGGGTSVKTSLIDSFETRGKVLIVKFNAGMNFSAESIGKENLTGAIQNEFQRGDFTRVILDLSDITTSDPSAICWLRTIDLYFQSLDKKSTKFIVCSKSESRIDNLIRRTNMHKMLAFRNTLEEALQA